MLDAWATLNDALFWALSRQETYAWWAAAMLVGTIAFPLAFVFFRRLPDRGYVFSKPLGLVLLGYTLWMGATVGLFPNNRGSVIFILAALAVVALIVAGRRRNEIQAFVREKWRYLLLVEGLFALTLVVAASLRSFVAGIEHTEKPMDFAFLNGILRADQFPAEDPWLAGHDVPLYHFGHIMVASLTKLTGLPSSITFNLGLALIGGMAAIAIFGLVYNLIITRASPRSAVLFGFVGVGLLLALANMEGFFELIRRHGVGSTDFYSVIDIDGLDGPIDCNSTPDACGEWYPTEWWFWWRATRISTQWDWREFPFFTFMLGDLHAHLLSIPFVMMAGGIALNVLRAERAFVARFWPSIPDWLTRQRDRFDRSSGGSPTLLLSTVVPVPSRWFSVGAVVLLDLAAAAWEGLAFWLSHPLRLLLTAILLGALGFTNLWDLPTFLGLVVLMAGIRNYLAEGRFNRTVVGRTIGFAIPLLVLSLLLYLPFYLQSFNPWGTRPVGGGIQPIQLATIANWPPIQTMATQPHHFMYLWLTILWPTLAFAVAALGPWREHRPTFRWAVLVAFLPFILWLLIVTVHQGGPLDEFQVRTDGPESWDWLEWLGTWWTTLIFLLFATSLAFVAAGRFLNAKAKDDEGRQSLIFALAAAGTAILILLGTELYWVQDPVGVRSNTVFRLNYQAWLLLSVSGAFGLWYILHRWKPKDVLRSIPRSLWVVFTIGVIGAGLVYPVTTSMNRTFGFRTSPELDGLVAMRAVQPSDFEAINWLSENVEGTPTILEAIGGDYSNFGRVSSRTGLPTLLGWPDHENRWRSSWSVQGTKMPDRTETGAAPGTCHDGADNDADGSIDGDDTDCRLELDVEQAYKTTDPEEALTILDTYEVEYVYVGPLERQQYGQEGMAKFASFMEVAYQNEGVTIYRMPVETEIIVLAP